MENFYGKITVYTEKGKRALIKCCMSELEYINKEEEKCMKKGNEYNKLWTKELDKWEELERRKKEILTELDILTK